MTTASRMGTFHCSLRTRLQEAGKTQVGQRVET
jgi:hypothetical protein